jgi:hypothetical protein
MAGFKDLNRAHDPRQYAANDVRSFDVSCWNCQGIMSANPWSDGVPAPTFGPRMVCTRCDIIGMDARPNVSLLQCSTPLPATDSCAAKRLRHPSGVVGPLGHPRWL